MQDLQASKAHIRFYSTASQNERVSLHQFCAALLHQTKKKKSILVSVLKTYTYGVIKEEEHLEDNRPK